MQAPSIKITPFDALKYIGILVEKGFSQDQAAALSEAQKSASLDLIETNFFTKKDSTLLHNDLFLIKNDIMLLKNEMELLKTHAFKIEHNGLEMKHQTNQKIEAMHIQMNSLATKADVFGLQIEMEKRLGFSKTQINSLENQINSLEKKTLYEICRLETKFDGKFNLLHWMLGFILTGMTALISGMTGILYKLFQF